MKTSFQILAGLTILILFSRMSCSKSDCYRMAYLENRSSAAFYYRLSVDSSLANLLSPQVDNRPDTWKCYPNENKIAGQFCDDPQVTGNKKRFLFLFDAQVIESTPWAQVQQNYLVLKKYELDIPQLDSANWLLIYP